MSKKIALITVLVLFAATALAQTNDCIPQAYIGSVEEEPVTSDFIRLRCCDDDFANVCGGSCDTGDIDPAAPDWEYFCSAREDGVDDRTFWYYFTDEETCSDTKVDYVNSVVGERDGQRRVEAWIEATCDEEWADYVCLWVEDEDFSNSAQSEQLNIDCTSGEVIIINPTTASPALRVGTDNLDVTFDVTEADTVSYELKISGAVGGICDNSGAIPGAGTFTMGCSWVDAPDGAYNVYVEIEDSVNNTFTAIETGALIIEAPDAPVCSPGASIFLLGISPLPQDDVLNLNEVCTDPEGGNLTFGLLDISDCIAGGQNIVETVTLDAGGMISVGPVPDGRNDTITDFTDTCVVDYRAIDETSLETQSYFEITIFQTGEIEIKMRYPSTADGGTDEDIQDFDLDLTVEPGDEVCFDLIIENNLSIFQTGKPLDLAFVLDASGSMNTEISSVKNTINDVTDFVLLMCALGDVPIADCFRLGIVVMEGRECSNAICSSTKYLESWQMDLTSDTESVKDFVTSVIAYSGIEPWADYVINLIDPGAEPVYRMGTPNSEVYEMSWREEVIRLIIVITDASHDGQTPARREYLIDDIGPVATGAAVGPIIVSGLGMEAGCDPNGCPLVCLDSPVCENIGGEMGTVAADTGGTAYVYQKDEEDIKDKIMDAIIQTVSDNDVVVELESGPPELIDLPIELPATITVERGDTVEIPNICITADLEEEFKFVITDPLDPDNKYDDTTLEIIFGEPAPVFAVITALDTEDETVPVQFDGGLSSSEPSDPIIDWIWNFGDGSPTQNGVTVMHPFADNDTYTVTLVVTTQLNNTGSETFEIVIENLPPTGNIEASTESVLEGIPVDFFANFEDPAGAIDDPLTYEWDFEDPPPGSGEEASHSWDVPGNYTVTVWVTDKDGGVGMDTKVISVSSAGDVLVINEITIFEGEEEATIFEPEDTIYVEITVANTYIDPDWELPMPVLMSWEIRLLDAITNEELYVNTSEPVIIDAAAEETFELSIYLTPLNLEEGNYIIEASVTVEDPTINEVYIANNLTLRTISVGFPTFVPVPEMPLLLLPLILLAVLILIKREQPKAE